MGRAGRTVAIVAAIAMVALVVATVVSPWTAKVPEDVALPLVARTVLQGEIAPDATNVDPDSIPLSPYGQECVDIERPAGPLFLCWEAYKDPHDADSVQDYYRLNMSGLFGGESGTGVRWVVVRAHLVGEPSNDVFEGWPDGVFEGPCKQVDVSLGPGPVTQETICGRTTGTTSIEDRSQTFTWTCAGCLLPDHADRAVAFHQFVAVPAGTTPTWEIFADLGG